MLTDTHLIHDLIQHIKSDLILRLDFCSLFGRSWIALGYDDVDMARIFQISVPTVGRWATAVYAPHPVGREPVLKALLRRLLIKDMYE